MFCFTLEVSKVFSSINPFTLSPALCAILFQGHGAEHGPEHGDAHSDGHAKTAGQGHGEKQALPIWGTAAIFAIVGYVMLTPLFAPLFGADAAAAGHGAEGGHGSGGSSSLIAGALAALVG